MCFVPQRRALFRTSTSQPPKVVRTWCVLCIFTWKFASRHNGVQFFDIATYKSGPNLVRFVHFDLQMCFAPQRRALFRTSTSQPPKVVRTWCVLCIFTWKFASRHNGVHFFDIATYKSDPNLVCFVHFDLQMCFAPQRRALFRHRNVQKWSEVLCTFWLANVLRATTACTFSTSQLQKWSEVGVFCTFWLGNVLRATTACTFSTSQRTKVVRSWCVLYVFTWKCASRHNGVHFFISHLASCLRTRRFSEPTFRPSRATNHWKNTVNRDFPTFSRICIFFLLIFSLLNCLFSLPLPCSAFHLSILSEV